MSSNAGGSVADMSESRVAGNAWFPDIPRILPHEKVREPCRPARALSDVDVPVPGFSDPDWHRAVSS